MHEIKGLSSVARSASYSSCNCSESARKLNAAKGRAAAVFMHPTVLGDARTDQGPAPMQQSPSRQTKMARIVRAIFVSDPVKSEFGCGDRI